MTQYEKEKDDADLQNGRFVFALDNGLLKGARIQWELWLGDDFKEPKIVSLEFDGSIEDIEEEGAEYSLSCRGYELLLNVSAPVQTFQAGCRNVLFGRDCGITATDFSATGIVQAGSTNSDILTNLPFTAGRWRLGVITFTSGLLTGISAGIKADFNANNRQGLTLLNRLVATPLPGDTFVLEPGCDHTLATCRSKFNNAINFRGEPFVPTPEATT